MNIQNIMNKEHRQHIKLGALKEEKEFPKFVGITPPYNWQVIPQNQWKHYTQRNQDGNSGCTDYSSATHYEAKTGIVVSARPPYANRPNSPSLGAVPTDTANCWKLGTTTETICPSDNLTETEIDVKYTGVLTNKIQDYVLLNIQDIDSLANAIDTYGSILLDINICWNEWNTEQGIPQYIPNSVIDGGHQMCGIQAMLWNGQKAILAQQSWGNDDDSIQQNGWVIFTENFLLNRGTGALAYIMQTYKYFNPIQDPLMVGVSPTLMAIADTARGIAGTPFVITSGLRTVEQNTIAGGVPNSAHLKGLALDIACSDTNRQAILKGLLTCGSELFIEDNEDHIHFDCDALIHPLGDMIITTKD